MESDAPLDAAGAATALQHVRRGRLAAARRVTTPWWYHPLVGMTLAVMLGSASLENPARAVLLVASLGGLLGLFWLYRRLTGLWVNALEVPGTRRATLLAVGVTLTVYVLAMWLDEGRGVRVAPAVAGVLLGAGYTAYWRWVERQLVRLWQAEL